MRPPPEISSVATPSACGRRRIAGEHQEQRRQHRRGIGADAEQADVAVLDADVPDIERNADRADAERSTASHCVGSCGQTVVSNRPWQVAAISAVARQKPATAAVGTRGEAARQHRIARPDEGARRRRRHSPAKLARPSAAPLVVNSTTVPASPSSAPTMCFARKPLARQQAGEQHDQERPEIIDQSGFGRRRQPQRGEIERMIAEQAADTERPDRRRLPQHAPGARSRQPDESKQTADGEGHRQKLERRHAARQHGQERRAATTSGSPKSR